MTDDQSTSLAEVARESYGDEFHGDPRDEPVRQDDRAASLSIDGALARLNQSDEPDEADSEAPPPAAASESDGASSHASNEALWTTEDVQTLSQFEQEAQRYQQDLQAFAQQRPTPT